MGKKHQHLSDIMRTVRLTSVPARVNPSVALVEFWRTQGVEITDHQLRLIQTIDQTYKPQTITREWQRQNKYSNGGNSQILGVKANSIIMDELQAPEVQKPRKKILGIF